MITRSCRLGLTLASVALVAVLEVGPAAAQSDQFSIRAIGITKMDTSKAAINRIMVACITPGTNQFVDCVPAGKAVVKVNGATKKKLKLSSAVIAKGPITARAANGEGPGRGIRRREGLQVRPREAQEGQVRQGHLQPLGDGSIDEVVEDKLTLTTQSSDIERLLLRSSGDTFEFSSRG